MIPVTFNSADAFLLDDSNVWNNGMSLTAEIPASYERGLSGRETRRGKGDTLRLALKYTATIHGSLSITTLRNSLQALNTQPVLCPFWPGRFEAGGAPAITSDFYALFDAAGDFDSIQPAASLGGGFAKEAYPLMVGILGEIPDPPLATDDFTLLDITFQEDSDYALTPAAFVPPVGIAAASGVRPLFPWRHNWSSAPVSGGAEVDIERQQIGELRSTAPAYYDQRGRRKVQLDLTLRDSDPLDLLAFFADMVGEQNNFWLPAALTEAALTQNVLTTDTALHVDDVAAIGTNTFVMLDDGTNRKLVKITGTSGSTWTLSGAVGMAFNKSLTRIESLILARFDVLKITLDFTTPTVAQARIKFKETPWEIAAVAGETIGVTMGALPATAILFVFTLAVPGSPVVSYFTNFERNLSDGAIAYTKAPLEFDSITETANLERQTTKLKSRNFPDNPLALLIPFQLEWPLLVDIYEADVTGSDVDDLATLQAAGRCLFSGEVSGADIDPPFINASCDSMRSIFDRQIPRRLYQRNDNWVLFETANGLLPANWEWNAVVVSYSAATASLVIGTITSSNGATLDAHFFAAGWLTSTHAGKSQARMIGDSTVVSGGHMTLSIATPFTIAPVAGDTIKLYPGYDGQRPTSINKFNNYSKFGGFPFMPVGNPSVLKINSKSGGAGKK